MPAPDGKRYYNECPRCGGGALHFVASRLPYSGAAWKPDDPLPEYREDCTCPACGHEWAQKRKGVFGEIIL